MLSGLARHEDRPDLSKMSRRTRVSLPPRGDPVNRARAPNGRVRRFTALEILARVEELNASAHIQPTRIGIGLHAGPAVTGNVGSARRKEYTIIGDTVNLAARIEPLNKQFGSRLPVSEVVWRAAGEAARDAGPLGPVPVKGHSAPVQVYRLRSPPGRDADTTAGPPRTR
jgi:adenylate cyclase